MPYITEKQREEVNKGGPATAGELNYCITVLCLKYLTDVPGYSAFNEVIGALECAKLEMYRRMVAPYEDYKRKENGDVYP